MKGIFLLILLFLSVGILSAQPDYREVLPESQREDSLMQALEHIPAFTIYKDNYIVTGTNFEKGKVTKYNSDAKFQISLRHRLFRNLLPYRLYVFLTYTQKSFWDIYRKSAPFTETTYN
ncbi:MAG: phospholipase A, partial [Odoribacter sp.]|nr:phospholipase A [Odoribacter sp.]